MSAEKEYDIMSWLYNTLYGDMSTQDIKNLYFVSDHNDLLNAYDKETIQIIDSACGNGVQATALALCGYKITATDISGEMVQLTNNLAKKHGVTLNTDRKAWDELPIKYKNSFDIIFCTGNSIVHSQNAEIRANNLNSLKQLLKVSGTLVIETRNWEKVLLENKHFTVYDRISYQDKEYIPLYHWTLNDMEQEAKVEIIVQEIETNNHVILYESELTFTPFTHQNLLDMLESMNLKVVKDTFNLNSDWYFLYAQ